MLTENPAIISYVADTHAAARLLPPVGELARYRALEWMAWCASTVHPQFSPLFRNKDDAAAREATQLNLDRYDQWLGGTFVLGDQFSAADAYTLVFYLWGKSTGLQGRAAHARLGQSAARTRGCPARRHHARAQDRSLGPSRRTWPGAPTRLGNPPPRPVSRR